MKKNLLFTICISFIGSLSFAQVQGNVAQTFYALAAGFTIASADTDEQAIRSVISSMEKGWNSKDGKLFASGFDKVHDYIVVNGLYLSAITPEINANAHQGIFNTIYKTTDLELRVDKINFVRPDIAMVYVLGATFEHGAARPENPTVIISIMVEKRANDWKIISFHNCDIEASFNPAESRSPIPPNVMYATWYKK